MSTFNHHCQLFLCMAQWHVSINTEQGIMKDSLENTSIWIKVYPSQSDSPYWIATISLTKRSPVLLCSKPSTTDLQESFVFLEDKLGCRMHLSNLGLYFTHVLNEVHCVKILQLCCQYLAMILSLPTTMHLLHVLIKSILYLNPNQTVVTGFDQPLYALVKKFQWFQPTAYGQQKLVLMLDALHIEIVMLNCLGDWLQHSGWTNVLSNAGVTSSGNDSLLSG